MSEKEQIERVEKALNIIMNYGSTDGGHHKQWVLDQVVRALTGCPVVEKVRVDYKGQEYSYETQGESEEYEAWIKKHNSGEDGPNTYVWDKGIAP